MNIKYLVFNYIKDATHSSMVLMKEKKNAKNCRKRKVTVPASVSIYYFVPI